MNIREKAEQILTHLGVPLEDYEVNYMITKLKDQDRDTRHACAESILDIQPICETPSGADAFSIDDIEKAIMNCRGGIE